MSSIPTSAYLSLYTKYLCIPPLYQSLSKRREITRGRCLVDLIADDYRGATSPPDPRGGRYVSFQRTLLATSASVLVALSTGVLAQQKKGNAKSSEIASVDEGEAVMIGPKGQRLHKSSVKITAANMKQR
jgi:hypothetical protein